MNHLAKLYALLAQGPREAGALRAALGVSAPTLSRLMADAPGILRFGRARATKYARTRDLAGSALRHFTVREVQPDGRRTPMGRLYAVHGGYAHVNEDGTGDLSAGLPWWLADMAPQGFLGRAFARHAAGYGLPPMPDDPGHWSDDQRLVALASPFWQSIGNLQVGEAARPEPSPPVPTADFPRLARAALAGDPAGSSAGGEQPKFCVRTRLPGRDNDTEVLVKFSWGESAAARTRRADLLVCECVAAGILTAAGIPAVASRLHADAEFTFLTTERADRVGEHGALGVVSLGALDDEFVGGRHGWTRAAHDLAEAGIIARTVADRVRRLEGFAKLIGNTDRHEGNLSFHRAGLRVGDLFPVYDMTPMHYAPTRQGLLPDTPPDFARILADAPPEDVAAMAPLARDFWHAVAHHPMISENFRHLAAANAEALTRR